jgi:predicted nucleotidyltransferase
MEKLGRVKVASLEVIFRALQEAQARYLVVGGVAVIAHGYVRVTKDLDLVLDLSAESLQRSLQALKALGYRPINPVDIFDFADPEKRRDWTENRNMVVFNLVSDRFPDLVIDIFTKEPFAFDAEYDRASWREFAPGIAARVVSLETLIALKTEANRPQDRLDIEKLRRYRAANE